MRARRSPCAVVLFAGLAAAVGCSGSQHEEDVRVAAQRFLTAWQAGDEEGVGSMLGGVWPDPASPTGTRSLKSSEVRKVAKALVSGQKPVPYSIVDIRRTLADSDNGVAELRMRMSSIGPADETLSEWYEARLLLLTRCPEGWKVDFPGSRLLWDRFSGGQIITPGIRPAEWVEGDRRE